MPGFLTGPINGIMDRQKGKGTTSSAFLQQIGKSTAMAAGSGNIVAQVLGTAVNPGATGADNVLAAWSLPANFFDSAGRGLLITAMGSVANNVNSKRIKIYFGCTTATVGSTVTGGTVIADTGAYTTTGAAGWAVAAQVVKYGNPGSNTQLALHQAAQIGSTVGALLVPTALTAAENAAIIVAVTGNAVTATTDILYNFGEIFGTN